MHWRHATARLNSVSISLILIISSLLSFIRWRGRGNFDCGLWRKWYFLGSHRHVILCTASHCGLLKVSHNESGRHCMSRHSIGWEHPGWSSHEECWACILLGRNIPMLRWRQPIGGRLSWWFKNAKFDIYHDKGDSSKIQFQWVKVSMTSYFLKSALQAPENWNIYAGWHAPV